MFDNEEFRVALTDVRTGERELWQKYKPRMIKAEQCLDEIEDLCKVAKDSNTAFYTLCDVVMLKIKEVKGE